MRLSTVGDGHLIPVVFGATIRRASGTCSGWGKKYVSGVTLLRDLYLQLVRFQFLHSAEFSFAMTETQVFHEWLLYEIMNERNAECFQYGSNSESSTSCFHGMKS